MYCIVLYCILLYRIVFYYLAFDVLYCIVFYCIVLYCIAILQSIVLYFIVFYRIVLFHCIALYFILLYCSVGLSLLAFWSLARWCIVPCCIACNPRCFVCSIVRSAAFVLHHGSMSLVFCNPHLVWACLLAEAWPAEALLPCCFTSNPHCFVCNLVWLAGFVVHHGSLSLAFFNPLPVWACMLSDAWHANALLPCCFACNRRCFVCNPVWLAGSVVHHGSLSLAFCFTTPSWFEFACCLELGLLMHCVPAVLFAIPAVLWTYCEIGRVCCASGLAVAGVYFWIASWFELACCLRLGVLMHCSPNVLLAIPAASCAVLWDWPGLLCIMARYRSRFFNPLLIWACLLSEVWPANALLTIVLLAIPVVSCAVLWDCPDKLVRTSSFFLELVRTSLPRRWPVWSQSGTILSRAVIAIWICKIWVFGSIWEGKSNDSDCKIKIWVEIEI